MEQAEFDKRFLALVNQSNVVITPANVAYHFGISIDEAQEGLLALELNGTLQQTTDRAGNTIYEMPNRPPAGSMPTQTGENPPAGQPAARAAQPPGVHNPADLPHAPVYGGPETAPVSGKAINQLVLNFVFPGLGSVMAGNMLGLAMMALVVVGVVMLFAMSGWSKIWAVMPVIIAYIWSIVAGISGYMSPKAQQTGGR